MAVKYKYVPGRIVNIDFKNLDRLPSIPASDQYHLILVEKGVLNIMLNREHLSATAPCIITLRENTDVQIISCHMLQAKLIAFDVAFLNLNITYDMINSGEYERISENFGFIPLNIFYENNSKYFNVLPLAESFSQLQEQFYKFRDVIVQQSNRRWTCQARLCLNIILELLHQLYQEYLNRKTELYNIKDPNTWVSLLLEKIHSDYAQDLSLITLSRYIHINKTTVSKYFKIITGSSVTDYIINYRLKCACFSLATTEITVKELAKVCGFKQPSYFIRQFTAKMKMTPTEYRRQCVRNRKYMMQQSK